MPQRATWGSTSVGQEVEGARGKPRLEPLLRFLRERQDKINSLGLANLNNYSRLWDSGWPWGDLGQEEYWLSV